MKSFPFFAAALLAASLSSVACGPDDTATAGTGAVSGDTAVAAGVLPASSGLRLVGAFVQLNDDHKAPLPDVFADVAYTENGKLSLSGIGAPSTDNLVCQRATRSRDALPGACDGGSPFALGIGMLFVVDDSAGNKNGKADPFTVGNDGIPKEGADPIVGFVQGVVLYSAKGGDVLPTGSDGKPALVDGTIPAGFSLWESYTPSAGGFDRLRPVTGPLRVEKKGPNLT